MTQDELEGLQVEKGYYHTMMSQLSGEIKDLKKRLKECLDLWETANSKYMAADRKYAMETKVRVIGKKKAESHITPQMAQELLTLLGHSKKEEEIEEEDLLDGDELLCSTDTV